MKRMFVAAIAAIVIAMLVGCSGSGPLGLDPALNNANFNWSTQQLTLNGSYLDFIYIEGAQAVDRRNPTVMADIWVDNWAFYSNNAVVNVTGYSWNDYSSPSQHSAANTLIKFSVSYGRGTTERWASINWTLEGGTTITRAAMRAADIEVLPKVHHGTPASP